MTTTVSRRFVILAGTLLISLLVLAMSVATSQAIITAGAGVGGGDASLTLPTQAQAQSALLKHGELDRVHAAVAPAATVDTASIGSTATTMWIVVAVLLAALTISVWALARRRRTARLAATGRSFCTLHPEDVKCSAA